MSRYVTYKLWGDCRAPNNLEFNGKLIGVKTILTTPTTQVIHDDDFNVYYCNECRYVFRYKKDAKTFNFCPCCGAKVIHDHENA